MKRIALFSIVLLAVFYGWYAFTQNPTHEEVQEPVRLNADVYPLYTGVSWNLPEATTSASYGRVVMMSSMPFVGVTNIAEKSEPFTDYYHDKLVAAGWKQDMSREAGGPGAEISVFTKGDQFVVVMFHSLFTVKHPDAPSECPCDVTLTLMSGTQSGLTPAEIEAMHVYHDPVLNFSVRLPTILATSTDDALWSADAAYMYESKGPGEEIRGVKFTIPASLAAGTNLAADTYVSVEHLPIGARCNATVFLADPNAKAKMVREGVLSYSVASSTDAAVGNRYLEVVYARQDAPQCIAVRYFIHYAAMENFPPDSVHEFDEAALLEQFDQIRRTLAVRS